jgi:hypothetical protein
MVNIDYARRGSFENAEVNGLGLVLALPAPAP